MVVDVERFIRVQRRVKPKGGAAEWRTIPNCQRLRVWHVSVADALAVEVAENANPKRYIFHVGYMDGIVRGCRVTYLGEDFIIGDLSDSTRLRGLELRCIPAAN